VLKTSKLSVTSLALMQTKESVYLSNLGEEERMERQTLILTIEPGPNDWEFSVPKPSHYLRQKFVSPCSASGQ